MYIPEFSELQELLESINIDVNNPSHVVAIADLRVKLRSILDTFDLTKFREGGSEHLEQLIKSDKISDDMINVFGPYMLMYLLARD